MGGNGPMLLVLNGQNPKPERPRQKAAPARLWPARVEPEKFEATAFVKGAFAREGCAVSGRFRSSSRVFCEAKNREPRARSA